MIKNIIAGSLFQTTSFYFYNDLEGKKFYNIEQLYQSKYEKYSNKWKYTGLSISVPPKYIYSISATASWGYGSPRGVGFSTTHPSVSFLERYLILYKTVAEDHDQISCTITGYNNTDEEQMYYIFAKYTAGMENEYNLITISGFRIKIL